ncbi:MAG: glycosyltransferase [Candidatus Roizmanbacteria bacterium]|nr:glycosyltransferase [Candidatus Roizmanbacteria bacterium]
MQPLVSIIITTKNEESVLPDLFHSIKKQFYPNIEVLVVDNHSTDRTVSIARKHTKHVFLRGPERSAQRNFGARKSRGTYLLFLDADMILDKDIVSSCVSEIEKQHTGGIIIPERSFGEGFWTRVKAFERSFYVNDDTVEAARFYYKKIFDSVGGFDETISGPEDWDLSDRVRKKYGLSRIPEYIDHNEGRLSLGGLMRKKYYYGLRTHQYMKKNALSPASSKVFFFLRSSYYRHPAKIMAHPFLFTMMFFMLLCEFIAGSAGFIVGKFRLT